MKRIDTIEEYIRINTRSLIQNNNLEQNQMNALVISQDLKLDRANISKDLNTLWRNGKILKVEGRPVVFYDISVLLNVYGISHLPQTIYKGESILDYLSQQKAAVIKTDIDSIDTMIGAKDSLADQVQLAKAAVAYPPYGLPILITGNVGVGKWRFASDLMCFAKNHSYKTQEANFQRIDCQIYAQNDESFQQCIFGASKGATISTQERFKKGMLEECADGFIYLDNIDKLSNSSIDLIVDLLERKNYARIGETQQRPLSCMIIASTSDPACNKIKFLLKYFPVHITIPSLDSRNLNEKIEIILEYFSEEAKNIHRPIRFHKDILACFALADYKENQIDLKNEIQQTCSRAYLDASTTGLGVLPIGYQHLSISLLSNKPSDELTHRVSRVLNLLEGEYILIDESGYSKANDYLKNSSSRFDISRMNQFVNEFNTDIEELDNENNYIVENITCLANCGNAQLLALQNSIDKNVYRIFRDNIASKNTISVFQQNPQLLYGILLHVSNLIKRTVNQKDNTHTSPESSNAQPQINEEYQDAERIVKELNSFYHINISQKEIQFIAMYLSITNNWSSTLYPSILLVGHGEQLTSDLLEYIKDEIPESLHISAVNFKNGMQINDLLEYVTIKARAIDNGAGILVISDYEPLLSISDYLRTKEGLKARTIHPLSIPLVMNSIDQIIQHKTIDQIAQYFQNSLVSSNSLTTQQDSFIKKLTNDYISGSLTFLNADKAVSQLMTTLATITKKIGIPLSNELLVKFIYQCKHARKSHIQRTVQLCRNQNFCIKKQKTA